MKVFGIVFQVGILDDYDFATSFLKAAAERGAFAAVAVLEEDSNVFRLSTPASFGKGGEEFAGTVRRTVVNNDDFLVESHRLHASRGFPRWWKVRCKPE